MSDRSSGRRWIAAIALGCLAAVVVALGTAAPGPGLDPDAQSYIGAAVSLVRSGDFRIPTSSWTAADTTEPLTHFPPGFPTLIAAPLGLGMSPLQAGRLVVVLAAVITWTMLVALVASVAGLRTGIGVGMAVLVTPAIVTLHLSILSEPPFLALLIIVLGGMMVIAERPSDGAALVTGIAAAAAVMVRYAGLAFVLAAAWHVWHGRSRVPTGRSTRVRRVLILLAPTVTTLVPWLLRSVRLNGATGVRRLGTYGDWSATLAEGMETVVSWIVPAGTGVWRLLLACAVAVAIVLLGVRVSRVSHVGRFPLRPRTEEDDGPPSDRAAAVREAVAPTSPATARYLLSGIVLVVAVCYLGFVIAARWVADPNIPFDERILAPLLVLGEVELGLFIATWWPWGGRVARAAVATVLTVWFIAAAAISAERLTFAREDGNDFASSDWRDSPTVAWVRSPTGGRQRALYTNWPAALYFQAGRASHDLPATLDGMALHRFRERLERSHGVVVAFVVPSPDVAPPDSLARAMGLRNVAQFSDGTIWDLGPAPAPSIALPARGNGVVR